MESTEIEPSLNPAVAALAVESAYHPKPKETAVLDTFEAPPPITLPPANPAVEAEAEPFDFATTLPAEDYQALRDGLIEAYERAARGKGHKRHANGKPFVKQPIMEISRTVGLGFPLGQAMKKIDECQRMAPGPACKELDDAICYLVAAKILLRETPSPAGDS